MANFGEMLAGVRGCRGVVAAAIADREGIPVETWGEDRQEVEEIVAEYSAFLHEVASTNRELQLGSLEHLTVSGSNRSVLITAITDEYFLLAVVQRDGLPGRARFASRVAASRLRSELV
jgi:predicted regulator of Ras-like GTPase activity (Roadblock/LC7/MglB family)